MVGMSLVDASFESLKFCLKIHFLPDEDSVPRVNCRKDLSWIVINSRMDSEI